MDGIMKGIDGINKTKNKKKQTKKHGDETNPPPKQAFFTLATAKVEKKSRFLHIT